MGYLNISYLPLESFAICNLIVCLLFSARYFFYLSLVVSFQVFMENIDWIDTSVNLLETLVNIHMALV